MKNSGLSFLIPYMRPYKWKLIIGGIFAVIGATAQAFSPMILGLAVDDLMAENINMGNLLLYSLGLVGLALILAYFRYLLRMLTGEIAAGISYVMSQDYFRNLLHLDQDAREQYGTGDLLSRGTTDFIYIWRFYSAGFQMSAHAFVLILVGCALMALASPALMAVVFVLMLTSILAQMRLGSILENSFNEVQQEMAKISSFTQEHFNAAKMLTAYAQEDASTRAFSDANQRYVGKNIKFAFQSGAISRIPFLVVHLSATAVIALGGFFIITGQLTVGQFVQFIVYTSLLQQAAQQLNGAFERLQQGNAAAARVGEILSHEPTVADPAFAVTPKLQGHIRFENVGVKLDGENRWAIRHVNLDIPAGTTLGIVGSTGSGKSILLSLLGRIRDPHEGRITIDGYDITQLQLDKLREAVVYVPQSTLLFSMPLRDNVALGRPDTPAQQIQHAIGQARLSNDLPQLPKGLGTMVGERGATLSGGQKQRTALARALVRNPKVLLLDDSLASVDTHTSAQILEELSNSEHKATRLIVSQRLAAVRDADQIVVLEEGHVIEQGTHDSLLKQDGMYSAMYERETQQANIDETLAQNNGHHKSSEKEDEVLMGVSA